MEPQKNKTSSRSQADSTEDFIPFVAPKVTESISEGKPQAFVPSEAFMAALRSDPLIRKEIEKWMESQLQKRLERELEGHRVEVAQVAQKEGFQKGFDEGKQAAVRAASDFEGLARQLNEEKVRLMTSHEAHWARAMGHLLRRFLVPRDGEIVKVLGDWMTELVADYSQRGRLVVYLASADFTRLKDITQPSGKPWELREDSTLAPGDLRCECEGMGIILNTEAELARLDQLITQHFTPSTDHSSVSKEAA